MKLKVRTAAGKTLDVEADSMAAVKQAVAAAWPSDFPLDRQRYICAGKPLKDEDDAAPLAGVAGVHEGATLHLLKKAGTASKPASQQQFRSVLPSTRGQGGANATGGGGGGMQQVRVVVPAGAAPGSTLRIAVGGRQFDVQIPAGLSPGAQFLVNVPA
jgi:hypothetical protein